MAGADVNTVIRLIVDGEERVVRAFDQVRQSGQRAGSSLSSSFRPAEAALGRMAGSLDRAAGPGRQFGGVMQQAGFQVGDFAVQLASGQNALIAFTQQGSQLISGFGPWGAVIGAAGAVVGALAVYFFDAGEEAATLEERTDDLGDAISDLRGAAVTGQEGLRALIEDYGALDAQLIQLIQRQTQFNLLIAKTELGQALGGVSDASGKVDIALGADDFLPENAATPRGRQFAIEQRQRLADEFGIGTSEVEALQEALAAQRGAATEAERIAATRRLGDVLSPIATEGGDRRLVELGQQVNDLLLQVEKVEEAGREAAESLELLSRPIPELTKLAEEEDDDDDDGGGGGRRGAAAGRVETDLLGRIDRLGLSERDAFIARETDRLDATATPERIENVARLAAELYDMEAALDDVRAAERAAATAADRHERELDGLVERIRNEARPEAEKYAAALADLDAVQDRLSPEEFKAALADIRAEFDPLTRAATQAGEVFGRIFDDAIANAEDFGDVLDIVRDQLRAYAVELVRTQVIQPLLGQATDALGGVFGDLFGGFAFGGGFTVPGAGGHDSVRAVLNLTPGERVDVTRPGEDAGRAGGITFNFYGPVGDGIASDPVGALAPAVAHIEAAVARTAARGQRGL